MIQTTKKQTERNGLSDKCCGVLQTTLLWIGITGFAIWAAAHYVYWITNPFPNEFREGVCLDTTHLIVSGINPFSMNAPASFFNMYGFLNYWLASGLSMLLDINNYALHRCVSVGCTVLAGIVIAWEVHKHCKSMILSLMSFLLMLATSWVLNEANARPDQLGVLLYVIALTLANRSQRIWSVIVLAVMTVAAFYVKQYFLVLGLEVFLFLLLRGKGIALIYGFLSAALLALSVILVDRLFPTYFAMTVLAFGAQGGSISHLLKQVLAFGAFYWPLLLFVIISFGAHFRHIRIRFNLSNWKEPLFNCTSTLTAEVTPRHASGVLTSYHVAFAVMIPILVVIGKNDGAMLSYFYQLLLPVVIIIGMTAVHDYCPKKIIMPSLLIIFVCSLVHYNGVYHFTSFLTTKEDLAWQKARNLLDAQNGRNVCLQVPIFVDYALAAHVSYYKNGLTSTGDNKSWMVRSYNKLYDASPMLAEYCFPNVPQMSQKLSKYQMDIENGINDGTFDLVVTGLTQQAARTHLAVNYDLTESMILRTGSQIWTCEFWSIRR